MTAPTMNRVTFKKLELSINRESNRYHDKFNPQAALRTEDSLTAPSIADDQTQYMESPHKRMRRADAASPAPIELATIDGT